MQKSDYRRLLSQVNKDGQEVHVCRLSPKTGTKRLKLEDRDPFLAKILERPPVGRALFSSCDIVTEIYSRRVDPEANDAAAELSDLGTCDGES